MQKIKKTIGSIIDTGPGKTTFDGSVFPSLCNVDTDIMKLLGYKDSSIIRDATGFIMKLNGLTYPSDGTKIAENLKTELALGNKEKNKMISLSTTGEPMKTALVYYKSLGDKSLAFFYFLYCLFYTDIASLCCLFTCDMFTSLYCLIFGVSFVFNTNEKVGGAKVTGIYHWSPREIDWLKLFTEEKERLVKEYDVYIELLSKIKINKKIRIVKEMGLYILVVAVNKMILNLIMQNSFNY